VCGVRDEPYSSTRVRIICRSCHHQTTATAGTIFEKTRTPLIAWFAAIWYVTNQKLGVSALGLQRVLGLASYQTAWTLLHKLRRAMVRAGRDRLSGRVEVDESYIGGREECVHGRQTETKAIVAIAVEVHEPKGFGRVRRPIETRLLPRNHRPVVLRRSSARVDAGGAPRDPGGCCSTD
jgi:hypothetical protein